MVAKPNFHPVKAAQLGSALMHAARSQLIFLVGGDSPERFGFLFKPFGASFR
ncbi:MAG TPA: hypothetical protein VHN11_21020 [Xanthobacteraceae bacterium]|nr:hypothetical protein [Xanthobacteraceae bacterium]